MITLHLNPSIVIFEMGSEKKRKHEEDAAVDGVAGEILEKKRLKLERKQAKKLAKKEKKAKKKEEKAMKEKELIEKKEKKNKEKYNNKKKKHLVKDEQKQDGVTDSRTEPFSKDSAPSLSSSRYFQSSKLTNTPQSSIDEFLSTNEVTIEDSQHLNYRPILAFDQISLDPTIASKLTKFAKPTPIQSISWPFLLDGKDVIGVAETGSGKTFAFGVPAINNIITSGEENPGLSVLCISPTRELALQIYDNLQELTKNTSISCVAIYGGVSKDDQINKIRQGANVIVATPGRLVDLINDGAVDLSLINYLVLDEADRMLEKGFEEDIKHIIGSTNAHNRQTLMFTATWPKEVRELANAFMHNPVKLTIGDRDELSANKRITQIVEVLDDKFQKELKLISLLNKYQHGSDGHDNKILVFALYKKEASRIESLLRRNKFKVAAIHGDLSQQQRTQALNSFKLGDCNLLLATDVAARGLDIPNVKYVINLTFPLTIEDYVHRIGRTGRAGQSGVAHTLFTEDEKHLSGALCNILRGANQPVPEQLLKFGGHTKKKTHSVYGAFYKDVDMTKTAKKIKFD